MGTTFKKNTNYVVAVDFEDEELLESAWLLGWSSKYDWFDCDTCGDEILTPTGKVKKNEFGLIRINRDVFVYVGETADSCKDQADSANKEGYNCTVCRIEKDTNGDLILVRA